jgi:uncharacterized membrane protein YphA (DoxX/SURF4 family)
MPSLLKIGRVIAAIGFLALYLLQAINQNWLIGRPDNPAWVKGLWLTIEILFMAVAHGMVFLHKRARIDAFLAGCFIFVFSFLIGHLPQMLHKDAAGILWQLNAYKTLALVGGCWILSAAKPGPPTWLNNKILLITGWITMALWLIIAGVSHIKFNGFVQDFMPAYIPAHAFWSYFTAVALLAGGVGLLINPLRQWAALLSGLMILLWFFLLHIPRAANDPKNIAEWLGVCESFIFSGILFVLSSLSRKQTS